MKTSGYKLREAIKAHELKRDSYVQQFTDSLKAFKDEQKLKPTTIIENFLKHETAVAKLQTAQTRYNLAVEINVLGEKMSLSEGVKRLGGASRAEGLWRGATPGGKKERSYYNNDDERDPSKERAVSTMTSAQILQENAKAARFASTLRSEIAQANAKEIEISELDVALLDG